MTEYSYNNMDRLETRIDPLFRVETYNTYDNNGNLTQFTDRKNQIPTSLPVRINVEGYSAMIGIGRSISSLSTPHTKDGATIQTRYGYLS